MELNVGDRIRIFEVKEGNIYGNKILGLQRPELKDKYFNNKYGVNLLVNDILKRNYDCHFNIDNNNIVKVNHVKHVATMVITKLKSNKQ